MIDTLKVESKGIVYTGIVFSTNLLSFCGKINVWTVVRMSVIVFVLSRTSQY